MSTSAGDDRVGEPAHVRRDTPGMPDPTPQTTPSTTPEPPPQSPPQTTPRTAPSDVRGRPPEVTNRTRISAAWVTAIVGALVLVVLLVFILQNQDQATVTFLGMSGSLPLGVALLLAAVAGALLVALLGAARILQLRRRVRRASGPRDPA